MGNKFTINKGDYIDSREFSREECERFCELAVECGYDKSRVFNYHDPYLGVSKLSGAINSLPSLEYLNNNITAQFRAYLDYKATPKSLLKDGMRCTDRAGDAWCD